MSEFRNADGSVNMRGFACGHVQSWTTDGQEYYSTDSPGVQLYLDGVWHVRTRIPGETHDHSGHALRDERGARLDWQSFDTLSEARRAFRAEVRRVKASLR